MIDKPFIARGLIEIEDDTFVDPDAVQTNDRVTFSRSTAGFHLTYHEATVVSREAGVLTVLVGPSTLVTWDRSLNG